MFLNVGAVLSESEETVWIATWVQEPSAVSSARAIWFVPAATSAPIDVRVAPAAALSAR